MRPIIDRTTIAILFAVLLTVGFTAATVAPAAATHNGGEESGITDAFTASDGGPLDALQGSISGLTARFSYWAGGLTGERPAAAESRDEAIQTFNQYNDSYVRYLNARDVHNGDVVEIRFKQNDEVATAYIVAEFNETSGDYESAQAVNSTSRAVDHKVTLRGMAADNAADELERFHDEFASENRDVTTKYISEMASKYKGKVDEPFTGSE